MLVFSIPASYVLYEVCVCMNIYIHTHTHIFNYLYMNCVYIYIYTYIYIYWRTVRVNYIQLAEVYMMENMI